MEVFALFLVLYLVAAPDRLSLALTRGLSGAARGAATGKTPKSRKSSPRGRAALAGWREGVKAARERREAGRDVWTRGSRGAGRVAGGTVSLARGIRNSIAARRARSADASADNATDADKPGRGWSGPRLVRRPRTAPTSEASGAVVDQDGNDVTPPTDKAAKPQPTKPEAAPAAPETTPEAPKANPAPKTPETALEPAPEPAPIGATNPNPHTNTTTTLNGAKPMALGTTELSNIDEYEKELKAVEAAVRLVAEAMDSVRKWGKNLPERWSAAGWGTAGLDRSVQDIAETIGDLKMPAVAEAFAAARAQVTKARDLGEAVDAVRARGKTEAFKGQ
ncbi:MAG TPA: hypothetical protein VG497_30415 [Kribbella sp.]|nr:hypothetical protein [Kribbella sp.]